jgi:hypothetical protein
MVYTVKAFLEITKNEPEERLYKFVLMNGENRTAIAHRNLDKWLELKEFSRKS